VICGSYDITLGTLNAIDLERNQPIIYSYDNIPHIAKLDYPVHAIGVPTVEIANKVVEVLDQVISDGSIDNVYNLEPQLNE
jgi:LacI family transcriptional regulator